MKKWNKLDWTKFHGKCLLLGFLPAALIGYVILTLIILETIEFKRNYTHLHGQADNLEYRVIDLEAKEDSPPEIDSTEKE